MNSKPCNEKTTAEETVVYKYKSILDYSSAYAVAVSNMKETIINTIIANTAKRDMVDNDRFNFIESELKEMMASETIKIVESRNNGDKRNIQWDFESIPEYEHEFDTYMSVLLDFFGFIHYNHMYYDTTTNEGFSFKDKRNNTFYISYNKC